MSQIKIQEFIVSEIKVNHLAGLKKGQTIAARDERSKFKWAAFLCERGYSATEAATIVADAHDMAILELTCESEAA
jgi:SOS response regulatory protein OraA/RecX